MLKDLAFCLMHGLTIYLWKTAKSLFHIDADACTRINGPETKDLAWHLNCFRLNQLRGVSLHLIGFKHVRLAVEK